MSEPEKQERGAGDSDVPPLAAPAPVKGSQQPAAADQSTLQRLVLLYY